MKIKKIERIINAKFDEWMNTIKDQTIKQLVKDNTILTGGCIASLLLNEQVNDFDFYFTNKETAKQVALYYVELYKNTFLHKYKNGMGIKITVEDVNDRISVNVKSDGATPTDNCLCLENVPDNGGQVGQEYVANVNSVFSVTNKEKKYLPIFMTSNAITLTDDIQIVIRFYGDPVTIHENYDFIHCTNYWLSSTRKVTTNHDALLTILTKELKYIGSKYPLASLFRTRKFIERGWNINAGQLLKIALQSSKLDFTNFSVLQDQLIGVDTVYFQEIIDALKTTNSQLVDSAYLVQLIDEIF